MSDWYSVTGAPGEHAQGSSATVRGEFAAIQAAFDKLPTLAGNGGELLVVNAGGTAVETLPSLSVALGGTGAASLTDHGILLGSGTAEVTATAAPTNGQVLVGVTGADPALQSGATLRTSIGVGTTDSPTFAALTLTAALTVANGGIGAASLTDHGILLGSGTAAITATAAPTDGQVLVGVTGADPALQSGATLRTSLGLGTGDTVALATLTLTNPLGVAYGGLGAATLGVGHVLIGNGTGAVTTVDMTTKGGILVGDGSGAPRVISVGSDNTVLTADAASTTGVKWSTVGGVGGIGTMTTVKVGNIPIGDSDIATINFNGLYFSVVESPDTQINVTLVDASVNGPGAIEIATQGEVNAGSSALLAVTPSTLINWPGATNTATVGILTSGTWRAGVIGVQWGGTGLSTMTDGGHLLGNATSQIEVTARPTLGEVLVGQTAGSPILQSGATLLSTLGVVNNVSHSGEVTGSTALTIAAGVVTNVKLASVPTSTIKGRISGGTGWPEDLTMAQVRSMINVEDGATADMTAAEIKAALMSVDGAGSGVDADLLDGIHAASFLRQDIGGTVTASLTVNGVMNAGSVQQGGVQVSTVTHTHAASAEFAHSLGQAGYQLLPGGMMIQWGQTGSLAYQVAAQVTFPIAFGALYQITLGSEGATGSNSAANSPTITYPDVNGFVATNGINTAQVIHWIAIGYYG